MKTFKQYVEESIQDTNNIKFVRFGGMSAINHKRKNFESDFHRPPVKNGVYAFIYPYIEHFLAAWKYPEETGLPKGKIFNHHGLVWTHMIGPAKSLGVALEVKDSWVLITTKDLPKVLSKQKSIDATEVKNMYGSGMMSGKRDVDKINQIKDPYKRGRGGFMSMDHLEVFIPGKIRETKTNYPFNEQRGIRLWVDDLRPMPSDYDIHAKTAAEAIDVINQGNVVAISFDHDLGPEEAGTGHDVAKWVEELAFNGKIGPIEWRVHSANPIGAKNIERAMQSAERFW